MKKFTSAILLFVMLSLGFCNISFSEPSGEPVEKYREFISAVKQEKIIVDVNYKKYVTANTLNGETNYVFEPVSGCRFALIYSGDDFIGYVLVISSQTYAYDRNDELQTVFIKTLDSDSADRSDAYAVCEYLYETMRDESTSTLKTYRSEIERSNIVFSCTVSATTSLGYATTALRADVKNEGNE